MVGVNARCNISIEVFSEQARRVAVDLLVVRLRGDDLGDDLFIVVDDAVCVHHLGQALHSRIVIERVDRAVVKIRTRFVHRRCRNARGKHEPHVDGKAFRRLKHVVDAVGSHNVRNLVGVRDDGRRAMRQRGSDKFSGAD